MENNEHLKDAITDGIEPGAVESTLEDIVEKSNELNKTPIQLKETVETIVEMKSDVSSIENNNYSSKLVRDNASKIENAITDGISPNEVATTLINSTNNANTKKSKKHLKFIVNLISKMKKKELKLKSTKSNSYQKIKAKQND